MSFRHHCAALTLLALIGGGSAVADDTTLSIVTGLWSDDLTEHDRLSDEPPAIPLLGVSLAGKLREDLAENIPILPAVHFSTSLKYGETENSAVNSKRISGDFFLMAPTNQYFSFATGYRYERAEDRALGVAGGPATVGSAKTELNSVRLGISGTLPVFQGDETRVFTSFFVAAGHQDTEYLDNTGAGSESNGFAGPELVIGYGRDIGKYEIDLRYRTALYTVDLSGSSSGQTQNALFLSLGRVF